MPNTDDLTGWTVTLEDDDFHSPSSHPWETETFWSAFMIPERKINGWFYNQVLANQGENGTCNGGCPLWGPDDVDPYSKTVQGVTMPAGPRSLNDIHLPNGNHIKTLEHLKRYSVRYSDPTSDTSGADTLAACGDLAREVGELTAFSSEGQALAAARLARCNAVAPKPKS